MEKRSNGTRGIPDKYKEYPMNILYKICKYKYGHLNSYDFINNKNILNRMLEVIDQLDEYRKDIIEMRFKDNYPLDDIGNKFELTDSGISYIIDRCIRFIGENYINYIIYDDNKIINIPANKKLTNIGLDYSTILILYREGIYSIDDIIIIYNTPSLIEDNRNSLMEIYHIGKSIYTYIVNQLKDRGFIDDIIPWKESNFNKIELSKEYDKLRRI